MNKEKILVAMSGGVDSAIVAYLVKQMGYEVAGATIKIGCLYGSDGNNSCCSDKNIADAKQMADFFGIRHYTVDLSEDFRNKVADYFIGSYLDGRTPNPCVECNPNIKFGKLMDFAFSEGMDKIATGHYAKIRKDGDRYLLCRAADKTKDQTYVLWKLNQFQLSHTLFPLAELQKKDVKAMANDLGIVAAHKKESQDICFIPDGDYVAFIKRATKKEFPLGLFRDTEGNIIGRHNGIVYYTPGQRKGLGIAFGEPMYVKSKSAADNSITLCRSESLYSSRIYASNINLIACNSLSSPIRVTAKIRYSQNESTAILTQTDSDSIVLEFDSPQRAVSPGQSVVMYDGDTVIGGGIIQ